MSSESLGKVYLCGEYKNGSIHTDKFSIRVIPIEPAPSSNIFCGDFYMTPLGIPICHVKDSFDTPYTKYEDSFIYVLLKPDPKGPDKQLLILHDGTEMWVNFRYILEKCDGYYQCTLHFCDDRWYLVPQKCDRLHK